LKNRGKVRIQNKGYYLKKQADPIADCNNKKAKAKTLENLTPIEDLSI